MEKKSNNTVSLSRSERCRRLLLGNAQILFITLLFLPSFTYFSVGYTSSTETETAVRNQSINQITEECSRCPQMRHEIQSLGGRKARQSSWLLICRRRGLLKCIHRIRQLVLGFMLWHRFFCFVGWRPCSVWRMSGYSQFSYSALSVVKKLEVPCCFFVCLFSSYSFPAYKQQSYCEHGAVRTSGVNTWYCLTLISWGSVAVSVFVFFTLLFIVNIVFPGDVA